MLERLFEIEKQLKELILTGKLKSMYIDYHQPYVQRIWFQHGEERVYLHKIEWCKSSQEALYHPHPWESAIRILKGPYEMGIGHSETNNIPITDCKLIVHPNSAYEMVEKDSWHYVKPIGEVSISLMVTGKRNGRNMPITPEKEFRKLTEAEAYDIFAEFNKYYKWGIDERRLSNLAWEATR